MKKKLFLTLFAVVALCIPFATACSTQNTDSEPNGAEIYAVTIDGEKTLVLKGEKVALPVPKNTDANKVFVEWQTEDGKTFVVNTIPDCDLVLVSVWRDKYRYTVKFDDESQSVTEGNNASAPVQPAKRDGYEFVGWFENGISFDPDLPIYGDHAYVSRWAKSEASARKDISEMDFTAVGELGGTRAMMWQGYVARDADGIAFRFEADTEITGTDGVGVFLHVGERTGTARSASTVLFSVSAAGKIEISNYPNNIKKTVVGGVYSLANGILTQCGVSIEKSTLELFVPYTFFAEISKEYATDKYDVMGFTFTSENLKTGGYDVWTRADMPGADGKAEVNRMNLADYLRISYGGIVYEYDKNDADVFLSGNTDREGVTVSCEGHSTVSGGDGTWILAVKSGGKNSLEIQYEKPAFETVSKTVGIVKSAIEYDAGSVELHGKISTIFGVVKDYATGEPVAGATIEYGKGSSVVSGADGSFELASVDISENLTLIGTAENYGDVVVEYTPEQLVQETFTAQIRLVSRNTEFTLRGSISDVAGLLENATVRIGDTSVLTSNAGNFEINVAYGDHTVILEKDGYVSEEIEITESMLLEGTEFMLNIGNTELLRTPVNLGNLGGTKVEYIWTGELTRSSEGLYFRFATTSDVPESATIGVGIFINLDYPRYSAYRTGNTYLIGNYTDGDNTYAYYPGTAKKSTSLNGVTLKVSKIEGTVLETFIPYTAFIEKGIQVNGISDFGISLTADFSSSTWDVWNRSDLIGMNGTEEVSRENSLDYVVYGADNTLKTYDVTMSAQKFESMAQSFGALKEDKTLFDNIASISVDSATSVVPIAEGQQIFTDRTQYKFTLPLIDAVTGMNFTYSSIGTGPSVTVTDAGYLILVLPATGSYKAVRTAAEKDGWKMVLQGYHTTGTLTDRLNYYVKWCDVGESFKYGKWNMFFL